MLGIFEHQLAESSNPNPGLNVKISGHGSLPRELGVKLFRRGHAANSVPLDLWQGMPCEAISMRFVAYLDVRCERRAR
jgi:hypothetical protein